jgi:hypothetical protein
LTKHKKIIITEIESITPGGRHVWLVTSDGQRIRKPIGGIKLDQFDFTMMETKTVMLESRLLHWGNWLVKTLTSGIGYPAQSTLVTALQGSPSTVAHYLPDNPDAEQIEKLVLEMAKKHKVWATVLRRHYTRENGETAERAAKALEMPDRTYRYRLHMARKWMEKRLKQKG